MGTPFGPDLTILSLASFMARAWKWIVLYVSLVSAVTIGWFYKYPSCTASGAMLIESARSNSFQALTDKLGGGLNYYAGESERIEKYLMIIGSRAFLGTVADFIMASPDLERFKAAIEIGSKGVTLDEKGLRSLLVERIAQITTFSRYASETIRVSVTLSTPEGAVFASNVIQEATEKAVIARESDDLSKGKRFLLQQLIEIKSRLEAIDDDIWRRFGSEGLESYGPAGGSRSHITTAGINDLEAKLLGLQLEINQSETQMEEFERQVSSTSGAGAPSTDRFSPQSKLSDMRRQHKQLKLQFGAYNDMIKTLRGKTKGRSRDQRELANLYKKKELEYQLHNETERQLMAMDVQAISVQSRVKTLEMATLSEVRSLNLVPNLIKRGILAILLACITVYLFETFNPLLNHKRDLGGLDLFYLGSIPDFHVRSRRFSWRTALLGVLSRKHKVAQVKESYALEILPDSLYDVIFKNVRARVTKFRLRENKAPKVIAVMSPHSAEGKSTLVSNLAKSLAMGSARVLVIDCDLRKRSLTRAWGLDNAPGISEFLASPDRSFDKPAIHQISRNLELFPAGKYSPGNSELIYGQDFSDTIHALKKVYDFIVLDTPPAGLYSEAVPISNVSDLIILSLMIQKTSLEALERMLENLRFASHAPIAYVLSKDRDLNLSGYTSYHVPHLPTEESA